MPKMTMKLKTGTPKLTLIPRVSPKMKLKKKTTPSKVIRKKYA